MAKRNLEAEIIKKNAEMWAREAEAMADALRAEALRCVKDDPLRALELCHRAGLLRIAARYRRWGARWIANGL